MGLRTLKQIEASRINGARSRGAVTAKQKLAAERNAIRYDLLAGTVVITGESKERFLEMVNTMAAQLQPANEIEASLIDTMAAARWSQIRIAGLRKAAIEREMLRHEGPPPNRALEALKDHDHSLAALRAEELDYNLQFDRALRLLIRMKNQHLKPGPTPVVEISSAGAAWEQEPEPEPETEADE